MSTCQPSSASARVNASPMRLAPPVTIAVRGLPNSGVMFRAIDPVERAGNRAYLCDDVQTADRPIFRRTDRPRRPWQRRARYRGGRLGSPAGTENAAHPAPRPPDAGTTRRRAFTSQREREYV